MRTLIKDVKQWVTRKHGVTNCHLTQILTGLGCFAHYLHRFIRSPNLRYVDCDHHTDDGTGGGREEPLRWKLNSSWNQTQ